MNRTGGAGSKRDERGFLERVFGIKSSAGKGGCLVVALVPVFVVGAGVRYCAVRSAENERIAEIQKVEEAKADEAAYQERVKTGQVCVDGMDDLNFALRDRVKHVLKDPDSFQHIGSGITPSPDGHSYDAIMRYRAKNSFGGYVVGTAVAQLYLAERNVCKVQTFRILER